MAYQITLTDEELVALRAAAAQQGNIPIEDLVHAAITNAYPLPQPTHSREPYIYPTGAPDTPEERAEDEELAALFAII